MKAWILAILLGLIALAPILGIAYYNRSGVPAVEPIAAVQFQPEHVEKKLESGVEFDVRGCKVIDGYRFELLLEGNKWIEAHLSVATKQEANAVVVDLLNNTTLPIPTVTLRRNIGRYWIVDFHLMVEGRRLNLVDVLRQKGLVL